MCQFFHPFDETYYFELKLPEYFWEHSIFQNLIFWKSNFQEFGLLKFNNHFSGHQLWPNFLKYSFLKFNFSKPHFFEISLFEIHYFKFQSFKTLFLEKIKNINSFFLNAILQYQILWKLHFFKFNLKIFFFFKVNLLEFNLLKCNILRFNVLKINPINCKFKYSSLLEKKFEKKWL